jgi:PAS domain S-box-containing protein
MVKDKKSYRILVIEDNQGDLSIVEEFLMEQIEDPVIVHTGNFKKAKEILSAGDPMFDVILLDLSLPDKSGQELVTEMLQIAPLSPVIILTGYADINFSIKSISQGIIDYLLKDELNATALYKSIIYAIERKKTISELKKAEKRAGDLFHLSPQPMWLYNPETLRFIQVNKAAIEHYGYSEEEFLNITLMDLAPIDNALLSKEATRMHVAESDEIYKGIFEHKKKSGEIIEVEIFSTPIIINNYSYRSVIAIDITEKNQYEHKIIKAIIKTQEDERYEIGAELHDNVCQVLAASQLNLGILRSSIAISGMKMFEQCRENISLALDEIRNLSHRLAPVFFGDSTLEEAFRRLFGTFIFDEKCKITLYFDPEVVKYDISQEIQLNLYRILQEQLRNILKHANASAIELEVIIQNDCLTMKISDNGVGYILNNVKNGIGLANMKRRTELFSGKFEVISSPGHGCEIVIDIPLLQTNSIHMKDEYVTA